MKRMISLLLALAMLGSMLAGCSGNKTADSTTTGDQQTQTQDENQSGSEPVTIRYYDWDLVD